MRRWLLAILAALVLGCTPSPDGGKPQFVGTDVSGAGFGKDFLLTDHTGKPRQLADFHGRVVALFFGYASCPDLCPTTMRDLARALKLMGERGREVQVLFVTVDPERDTPQALGKFMKAFNPTFLGLSGSAEAIDRTTQDFRIFVRKQPSGAGGSYLIDHNAGIYVFDKRGKLRLFIDFGQTAEDIAHDLALLL